MTSNIVKLAILASIVSFATLTTTAQAKSRCDQIVSETYRSYIEDQTENQFDMVNPINVESARKAVQESYEISDADKTAALQKISNSENLLYNGVSNYMSGTGLELLIVDAKTCVITDKYFWYAE